ncbi:MAG: UDP-N-acetylmuramate dehydrogenase [Deltaproteobacteria bacterium]|nr:UDP-N-acetylmuramate dehydrogenase [Deltaproteobacteria bacterium]
MKILLSNPGAGVYLGHPLAPLTTWKIGGPAEYLAVPQDLEDVYKILSHAYRRGRPVFFLGRGSNVLISDAGLPGLTLHLAKSLQKLARQGEVIRAGAGVSLPRLAQAAADWGLAGCEFLAGIPGTVGAAVRLNAGAQGSNLGQLLKRAWVLTPRLQLLEFAAPELGFAYRSSLLLNFPHWLVVEAEFALTAEAPPEAIQARMRDFLAARRASQPSNPRSCGSVFKNPPDGPPAGYLIEQVGFKGRRCGGAQVSWKHANFILNQGGATAADIKTLIHQIQETVWVRFGIKLEREVVFLPEDLNMPSREEARHPGG